IFIFVHAGPGLHHLLRDYVRLLPALPLSPLAPATADGPQGLPAGIGARRGGVGAADVDGLEIERRRFRPADRAVPDFLASLVRRSICGAVSASRAVNGGDLLVDGDTAARPARCPGGIVLPPSPTAFHFTLSTGDLAVRGRIIAARRIERV